MTAIIIAFVIGALVGGFIGALAVAMCNASAWADRQRELENNRDYREMEY